MKPMTWTKTGKTAREVIAVVGGPTPIKEDLTVPAGTKVVFHGHWIVRDLGWLKQDATHFHDAENYGIAIEEVDVTDILELKRPHRPRPNAK